MSEINLATRLSYGVGQLSDGVKQSAFSTFLFFYYNQVLGLSGSLAGSAALLALMVDVRAGKTNLAYTVADGGHLKTYRATVLGREEISTYLGTLQTVKVGSGLASGTRQTTLWLAPSLQYLPVQVERQDEGEVTRMTLLSTEGLPIGD